MKFDELPGVPQSWIEFTVDFHSKLCGLAVSERMQALAANEKEVKRQAKGREVLAHLLRDSYSSIPTRTRENIERLKNSESVVVVACNQAGLFGGTFRQALKCLTAIKICEELVQYGVPAVPVCWISALDPADISQWSVNLLDNHAELHNMHVRTPGGAALSTGDSLALDSLSALISRIEEIGCGSFDDAVIETLREACSREGTLISASARFLTDLMGEWGLVVLDSQARSFRSITVESLKPLQEGIAGVLNHPKGRETKAVPSFKTSKTSLPDLLVLSFIMPVVARVLDFDELDSFEEALPVFDALGYMQPKPWPCASATMIDARARKTLERYNLKLNAFFAGEDDVLKRLTVPHSVSEKLKNLESEVERQLEQLKTQARDGADFSKMRDSCKEKIVYQIGKLRNRFESANAGKKEAMGRHIHRAANLLAPNRQMQENGLSMLGFLLHHTRFALGFLHEKLDIMNFDHQLLFMD